MLLLYYGKLNRFSVYSSGSFTTSWYHHLTVHIVPVIRSTSAQSSYMGQQATFYTLVNYCFLIYSLIRWIPAASISATTGGVITLLSCSTCRCHPHDPPGRPLMEPLHYLEHLTRHHPDFTVIQQHRLLHRLIHHTTVPHHCFRLYQHPLYHPPLPLRFPQVFIHRRPIAFVIGNFLSKVREGLQRWKELV